MDDQIDTSTGRTPDSAALELVDVGVEYRDVSDRPIQVLSNLGLTLLPGQLVCLAGRSGSGKTTALMVAAGLLRPTAGVVRWGGVEIARLTTDLLAKERGKRIGFVFQSAALIPSLRARENVALAGMTGNGVRPEASRVEELLSMLGLAQRGDHFPAQLSGGEQQRVALARALYRDPPMLLVDEPTANLDRATSADIIALLGALRSHGRSLLVASHDDALLASADLVVYMEHQ